MAKQLEELLGFESDEVAAYLALNKMKDLSTGEIASLTRLSVSRVGRVLDGLLKKGLIIKASGTEHRFVALHPALALHNLFSAFQEEQVARIREKKRYVEGLVSALTPIHEKHRDSTTNPKLMTSVGETGFWAKMIEIISATKSTHKFATTLPAPPSAVRQAYEEALVRGVEILLLLPVPEKLYSEQADHLTRLVENGLRLRAWVDPPLTFCVSDTTLVGLPLISDEGEYAGVWALDTSVSSHFNDHFDTLWSKAKDNVKITVRYGS